MALKYKTGQLDEALKIVEDEGYHGLTNCEKSSLAGQLLIISALAELMEKIDDLEAAMYSVQSSVNDLND